ncbi:hypothetical protein CXF89_20820 [Pseudoalteromonas sp. MelDa3]|nr:hypothetical protein CXF89_20820 [Pseudoalteromonas sp. MelDa3]
MKSTANKLLKRTLNSWLASFLAILANNLSPLSKALASKESTVKYSILFLLLCNLVSFSSSACSIAGWRMFSPTPDSWNAVTLDQPENGFFWELVPQPVVELSNVSRGSGKRSSSCSDFGIIELSVSLPETSSYKISDFGVYVRLIDGKQPDLIFPDTPMTGRIESGVMKLVFPWLEPQNTKIMPLNLTLDIFLVSHRLNVGKSVKLVVK